MNPSASASLSVSPSTAIPPLGVVAGSGILPQLLLSSCSQQGREVFVIAFEEETRPDYVENFPHIWISLGSIGSGIEALRRAGVTELVMAGKINRPKLSTLRPDMVAARLMAHLGMTLFSGDNALFSAIVGFLEREGFAVIGADQLLEDLVTPEGPITRMLPGKQAQKDIEIGVRLAHLVGGLDVGQAVIVKNGLVLGVEAVEGTDALIERCVQYGPEGTGGVLIKAKKPLQERRVDLPAIGITTIEKVYQAGFSGIALEAGGSLILDRNAVRRRADELGIFIVGFSRSDLSHAG